MRFISFNAFSSSLVGVLLLMGPSRLAGQETRRILSTITIDHATRTASLTRTRPGSDPHVIRRGIRSGSVIALDPSDSLVIAVENTNTAFFTYRISSDSFSLPNSGVSDAFQDLFKSYVPDVIRTIVRPKGETAGKCEDGNSGLHRRLESATSSMRSVSQDLEMLRVSKAHVDAALDEIRVVIDDPGETHRVARALRDSLSGLLIFDSRTGFRLTGAVGLVKAHRDLAKARRDLESGLLDYPADCEYPYPEDVDSVRKGADEVLRDWKSNLQAAQHLEQLVRLVISDETTWHSTSPRRTRDLVEIGELTPTSGTRLTVEIRPVDDPMFEMLELGSGVSYEISAVSMPKIKPIAGASLLVSPASTFPEFSARPSDTSDSLTVVETGETNNVADYAAVIGLAHRLGASESWFVVVPQIGVNPSKNIRSFSLGAGIAWRWITVGMGVLWTKHDVLDGLQTGERIRFSEDLHTRESYGAPRLYFSVALVAFPGL